MIKLSDIQSILLSSAAQRADGSLLPAPGTLVSKEAAFSKALAQLVKRQLADETTAVVPGTTWREDGDHRMGLVINKAGRTAIGVDEDAEHEQSTTPSEPPAHTQQVTKASMVLALLRRDEGATLEELVSATGWLPHTTRAALTGIRKKGHEIEKAKRDLLPHRGGSLIMVRLQEQLDQLVAMAPAELREEWRRVYRADPPHCPSSEHLAQIGA